MYCETDPSSALANPTFVFSGFEPSLLKLSVPLKFDDRAAGRVVCSTKSPVLIVCEPFSLETLPEMFHSVL